MEDRFRVPIASTDRGYTTTKEADPNDPRVPRNVQLRRQFLAAFEEMDNDEREIVINEALRIPLRFPGLGASKQLADPTERTKRITVHDALDHEQENIGELHNGLHELEGRLHTVLSHDVAEAGQAPGGATPMPVLLVDRVHMHSQGVRSASNHVQQLLARLTV